MPPERGFRIGDRVVLHENLPTWREREAERRGLPLGEGGYIESRCGGNVVVVVFGSGRQAFMRGEDLRMLTPVEERVWRRDESKERRRLAAQARESGYFTTPETVEESYRLGERQGYREERHLNRTEFLITALDHPHPDSLWKAYKRGHRVGRRQRAARTTPAAGKLPPAAPGEEGAE